MRARLAVLLTALTLAAPARAGIVTVKFGGVFAASEAPCSPYAHGPTNCVVTPIATPFAGSFSYATESPSYLYGVTLTSDAFAPLGLATTLTGATGQFSYAQQSGNSIVFGNMLGSFGGFDLATLTLTYPAGSGVGLAAALPPLSAASSAGFSFVTDVSPGGTGAQLSGALSYFTETTAAAVPEAPTWAAMLGGVAFAGGALRRRRRAAPACA